MTSYPETQDAKGELQMGLDDQLNQGSGKVCISLTLESLELTYLIDRDQSLDFWVLVRASHLPGARLRFITHRI